MKWHIDCENRLVRVKLSGSFTFAEIASTISAVVADPDFEAGFNVLSDHRELTEFLTPEQAMATAELVAGHASSFAHSKMAVVTVHPASVGMINVVSVFLGRVPMEARAFSTEEDALLWLAEREAGA